MTDTRARIHALLNLDQAATGKLNKELSILIGETIQDVLRQIAYTAGDHTAETIRDHYPHLEAWLRGETPAEEPPLDLDALQAAAEAEKAKVCECGHFRDKHHRDFHNGGGIICGTCTCQDFTDRQDTYTSA
jgi:hypothetical protein